MHDKEEDMNMYLESNATVNYVIIISIIGDEFHFILECTVLNGLRFKCLHYQKYPNAIKFSNLLNFESPTILQKLCKYIGL